ncbi:MAG: hypothetical protein EXS38_05380 [Opitutus sp.]|nr:hypothetical protein [Opitutus sp.]
MTGTMPGPVPRPRSSFIVKLSFHPARVFAAVGGLFFFSVAPTSGQTSSKYQIFVSNEKSGDLTVIDGANFHVSAIIPVGKRPRGVQASADGKTVYVALSGTPIETPKFDAKGNPVFEKREDDDDTKSDKSADGIGLVDVAQRKFLRKISAGSDPEQFCLSPDGKRIYAANEDVGAATVIDATSGKILTLVKVGREPEGVGIRPDGKIFYVTCETAGDVFAIDAQTFKVVGHLQVHPRPRSIAFLPDGSRGFVPSESVGELNVIDTVNQTLLKVITLPKGSRPMTVVVSSDGKKLYVSNGRAGTLSVLDAGTYDLLNTIKVGTRPWGIALSPDGKFLFSANGPSDDISVVDLTTEKEITRIKSPGSPWGVAVVPTAK